MTSELLPESVLKIYKELKEAKDAETLANRRRVDAESRIIEAIRKFNASLIPKDGSKTIRLPGGGKVCLKAGISYKADLNAIKNSIREECEARNLGNASSWILPPPIKITTKEELDLKGYEWYRNEHPEVFSRISKHVTVTPKKIGVVLS